MKRILLLALLLCLAGAAVAQSLEIITLQHQTAEDLLPQLRPLVEPGGALTGTGSKLFLRTTPRNKEDILRVLQALDREARRLLITVRQGGELDTELQGGELSGNIALGPNGRIVQPGRPGPGARVDIRSGESVVRGRVYGTHNRGSDNISQQIQTIEGGRAFIQVGRSMPVPMRQVVMTPRGPVVTESVTYQDIGTGFYAQPRLSGSIVTLEISPSHDTPGAVPGSANVQRLTTTISGRLGEWIPLGGSTRETSGEESGTGSYSSGGSLDSRQVWLKVEELQ